MASSATEKQATFKFFRSFYEAALEIEDPAEQAAFFRAICAYALDGEVTDTAGITAAMFRLIKPVIDKSFINARNGKIGGVRRQEQARRDGFFASSDALGGVLGDASGDALDYARKREEGRKEEGRKEEGREEEKEKQKKAFSLFWQAYPRKVGQKEAFAAFLESKVELNSLLQALERHKKSEEWQRQSGRFIPNPANYLRARRFEDLLPAAPASSPPHPPCDDTMRRYIAALHERRPHEPR